LQDFASGSGSSNTITLRLSFPPPDVAKEGSWDSVTMSTLPLYGAPGDPVLPFRQLQVLIPQGKQIEGISVTTGNEIVLRGRVSVAYGRTPLPTSSNVSVNNQPDEAIYNSAAPFPASLYSDVFEQYLRGYEILIFRVFPVQYIPKTGELSYFETLNVTVTLKETGEISPFFRGLPQDEALLSGIVDNIEAAKTYSTKPISAQQSTSALSSNHYDYVLITSQALSSVFQPLVDWKKQRGLNATIVLIEDIMKNPNYNSNGLFGDGTGSPLFNDTQAHIRNFIKDAYANWGVEYVLLGGDDDVIPARGVYANAVDYGGNYTDSNIPCDMYYGGLDGSWDRNNDTIFGEAVYHWAGPANATAGEEADFFAEVYVGRAPVDTPQKATNFVSKTIAYEQSTQADYLKKALFVGTKLDDITEGGNGEDAVAELMPQYSATRLYARDGTYSRAALIGELNSGTHIVNDDGHANYQTVMGLSYSDVDSLANTQYFLVYSLGCYSAAFDQATSGAQGSIAEHFLFDAHGAFAYIGNSRYGWYCSSSINGPGERYDRSFFSVLNSGTRNLGKALQLSKEEEPILDRWTCFTLNLLGDPETPIFTAINAPTAHFVTRTDLLTPPRVGGSIDLQGTAKRGTAMGTTFSNFTVDFGVGISPTSWASTGISLANSGLSEVDNATLATWNTTKVASGTYTLRLTSFDANGLIGQDKQVVVVSTSSLPVYIRANGTVDPSTAPILRNGNVYTLTGNIYSDSEGIVIERSNIILDGAGFVVQGSGGGAAGIYMSGISGVTIKNVVVESHLYGIYLESCQNITILVSQMNNDIHGIFLLESSYNMISGTNVTNNYDGINLLSGSNNNNITGCRVIGNNGTLGEGIYLYMSSNNLVYHNVLSGNRMNVYDAAWDCADPGLISPSINRWDNGYPSGGNYWSDYVGTDNYKGIYQNISGSDGIGDASYFIDMNNLDRYPRMTSYLPLHDVAVTDVVPSKTLVGLGYCLNFSVTMANYGVFEETCNLTVRVNSTVLISEAYPLKAGSTMALVFTWNCSGSAYGNFTFEATVGTVMGEVNISNNDYVCNVSVHVGIPGDVSSVNQGVYDTTVNMRDIAYMIMLFNTRPGSPNWNPNVDVNNDGVVNMRDIATAIFNFNRHE
jgi:parallel beta-helix repeat protein